MKIRVLKLVSGDEIICQQVGEDADTLTIADPLVLHILAMRTSLWFPLTHHPPIVAINRNHIVGEVILGLTRPKTAIFYFEALAYHRGHDFMYKSWHTLLTSESDFSMEYVMEHHKRLNEMNNKLKDCTDEVKEAYYERLGVARLH